MFDLSPASQKAQSVSSKVSQLSLAPSDVGVGLYPAAIFEVDTKSIFDGAFLNKKYGNEMLHRSRFCWVDHNLKRFFWSKTEGKMDPKKKSLSLIDDIALDGISCSKNKISLLHVSQKVEESINLELSDDSAAADWLKVLVAIKKSA